MKETSRAAFEAWAETQYPYKKPAIQAYGTYEPFWQCAWESWQASRKAALEEAVQVCERLSIELRDLYKGRTKPVQQEHYYNPHTDSMSDGCTRCEDAIRGLK